METLTLYTDIKAFKIHHPIGKLLRETDIVFRCYLYEVCKTFKEYNVMLKTLQGKEVEITDVVKKGAMDIYVWSRAGEHIRTALNVLLC